MNFNIIFLVYCCLLINSYGQELNYETLLKLANDHHLASGTNRLSKSTWPSDHHDSSRSKYTLNAGLPKDFDTNDIKIQKQNDLIAPQWLYTQGDNSEFLWVLGGSLAEAYLSKVDSQTLEIIQKIDLPKSLYLGGLLMHGNGHVYGVHANILYKFWLGDLYNSTSLELPSTLNQGLVQTNGMIITQDGYLVIKQWAINIDDIFFYISALPPAVKLIYTILFFAFCSRFQRHMKKKKEEDKKKSKQSVGFINALIMLSKCLFESFIGSLFIFLLLSLFGMAFVGRKSYDPIKFFTDSSYFAKGTGRGNLKIIDADSLTIIEDVVLPERCSVARMALTATTNKFGESEDVLFILGDELVFQYRWKPSTKKLVLVPNYTKRYRTFRDGSYQATGASIYNNSAYFTDNTFPAYISGHSYRMYKMSLDVDDTNDLSNSIMNPESHYEYARKNSPQAPYIHLAPLNNPGFMFWSVVVSPISNEIIVWDTANHNVEGRSLTDLKLKWRIPAANADCLSVAADKGHVYFSDYSKAPYNANHWLGYIGRFGESGEYSNLSKYFVVGDSENGEILLNVTIDENTPMKLSMIIPGANNDVFIGTPHGLVRIYV